MLRRGERGVALLVAVCALAVVQALLAALWLWSHHEAREAAESLAASRAEWAAVAAEGEAMAWLAARAAPPADTTLAPFAGAGGSAAMARVTVHGPDLVALEVRGEAPASPRITARRTRCRWLVRGAPDSAGERRWTAIPGGGGCS